MMALKVLLLGRPGSGKTTAARYFLQRAAVAGLQATHVDDYDLLEEKCQADAEQRRFRPLIVNGRYCGFDVLDFGVMDEVLLEAEARVEQHLARYPDNSLAMLEFARDDYLHALHLFSPRFLRDAQLLYFRIDVETAIQRVRQRYCQTGCQLVSEQVLRSYYRDDGFVDQLSLIKKNFSLNQTIEICDNNETLQLFLQRLDRFFEQLLRQEARAGLIC
ncbi:MAG: hypothetical protein IRZ31_04305 [Thermogemmatispora sp.]|uniref:hypothetical protein n=1 Tax=Thermogemmatispora sp. TaxID=1968838 RepID=UPI002615C736|nr:hypothetical protein [Thermogemmatispora sp.]MBX5456101.1 hypothetical protein [Thermogemmatispora sp.]